MSLYSTGNSYKYLHLLMASFLISSIHSLTLELPRIAESYFQHTESMIPLFLAILRLDCVLSRTKKYFQYAENMIPLFLVILKIHSLHRIKFDFNLNLTVTPRRHKIMRERHTLNNIAYTCIKLLRRGHSKS